jgi:transposase
MQRLKLILRLLQEGMPQGAICAEVQCSKSTVSRLKQKAGDTGRSIGELLQLPDDEFVTIFGVQETTGTTDPRKEELLRMMPEIMRRLGQKHAHMQYVYDDYYSKECPEGYKYTQFKKYVKEYRERHDYSYHNTYEPGKEWQIDFAGDALWLTDRKTGERQKLVVLVCVMPYSNLPFMMAMPRATTERFCHGLNKGLEFMGALPAVAKSDNMKQWVTVRKMQKTAPLLVHLCGS